MNDQKIDNIFIYWIYFVSIIIIFAYVLESYELISGIFRDDISYISTLILFIFLFYLARGGIHLYKLRDAFRKLNHLDTKIQNNIFFDITNNFLQSSVKDITKQDELKSKFYEIVDDGFFISDLLLKLGIVGTVIGFILMLSSLSTIDEMNLSKMNNLLLSMSGGMKVALYTTLSGLIGSILLTIQNNYFESKINAFISEIINSCHDEKKN